MTAASPLRRFAAAHSRSFSIPIRRGCITHSCCAFCPPASAYSLWMSKATYLLIPLVSFSNFMLHSLCWLFPDRISGLMWDVDFWFGVAATDSGLVYSPSQIRIRGCPNNAAGSILIDRPIAACGQPRRSHPSSAPAVVSPQGYAHATSHTSTF